MNAKQQFAFGVFGVFGGFSDIDHVHNIMVKNSRIGFPGKYIYERLLNYTYFYPKLKNVVTLKGKTFNLKSYFRISMSTSN